MRLYLLIRLFLKYVLFGILRHLASKNIDGTLPGINRRRQALKPTKQLAEKCSEHRWLYGDGSQPTRRTRRSTHGVEQRRPENRKNEMFLLLQLLLQPNATQ